MSSNSYFAKIHSYIKEKAAKDSHTERVFLVFVCLGANTQWCSGITLVGLRRPYKIPGIKFGLVTHKVSITIRCIVSLALSGFVENSKRKVRDIIQLSAVYAMHGWRPEFAPWHLIALYFPWYYMYGPEGSWALMGLQRMGRAFAMTPYQVSHTTCQKWLLSTAGCDSPAPKAGSLRITKNGPRLSGYHLGSPFPPTQKKKWRYGSLVESITHICESLWVQYLAPPHSKK